MNNGLILAVIALGGIFGLLFLARSIRRLCQGQFLNALAAFFLATILFSFVAIAYSWLMSNARNPKTIADIRAKQMENKIQEPQQPSPGDVATRAAPDK